MLIYLPARCFLKTNTWYLILLNNICIEQGKMFFIWSNKIVCLAAPDCHKTADITAFTPKSRHWYKNPKLMIEEEFYWNNWICYDLVLVNDLIDHLMQDFWFGGRILHTTVATKFGSKMFRHFSGLHSLLSPPTHVLSFSPYFKDSVEWSNILLVDLDLIDGCF